jgi:hypothetical protein
MRLRLEIERMVLKKKHNPRLSTSQVVVAFLML